MSGNYIGFEPAPAGVVLVGDTAPVGTINWFHKVPDVSYLQLNGQVVVKASYPDLWIYAQGFLTADQVANPGLFRDVNAATFAVPNLAGLFVRATGGIAAALGVKQGFNTGKPTTAAQPAYISYGVGGGTFAFTPTGGANEDTKNWDAETRPDNVALIPCMKALRVALVPGGSTVGAASPAEVTAGTVGDKYVSPATQQYHKTAAKAWVNFTGVGPTNIRSSFNVISITDNAVGDYTINFATPMVSTNYTCAYFANANTGAQIRNAYENFDNVVHTVNANRMYTLASGGAVVDSAVIGAIYFGD